MQSWLLLALLLLAAPALAQGGAATLSLGWQPERPEPDRVADYPLWVDYNWTTPAATVAPTAIELRVQPSEIALNATIAPATVFVQPTPAGGSARGNATLHLRWLFAPHDDTSARVLVTAMARENGNLPAAQAEATVTVLWPMRGIPASPPAPDGPAARAASGAEAALALACLTLAAGLRRRHA